MSSSDSLSGPPDPVEYGPQETVWNGLSVTFGAWGFDLEEVCDYVDFGRWIEGLHADAKGDTWQDDDLLDFVRNVNARADLPAIARRYHDEIQEHCRKAWKQPEPDPDRDR